MGDVVSVLDRPVYTYPQVDRLLNLTAGTSRRWLNGYRRNRVSYPPILRPEPTDSPWVTWGEFVETRLFAGYRDINDIPVQRMRRVVEVLRSMYERRYPLAYAGPYLQPTGRRMLWQAQLDAGLPDEFTVELDTGQLVLTPWVSAFAEAAAFDDTDGRATALTPDPDFPAVRINPEFRSGEPVIDGRNVRVSTLAGLVRGGERPEDVAEWYDLDVAQVREAVNYDRSHLRIA